MEDRQGPWLSPPVLGPWAEHDLGGKAPDAGRARAALERDELECRFLEERILVRAKEEHAVARAPVALGASRLTVVLTLAGFISEIIGARMLTICLMSGPQLGAMVMFRSAPRLAQAERLRQRHEEHHEQPEDAAGDQHGELSLDRSGGGRQGLSLPRTGSNRSSPEARDSGVPKS